MAHPEMEDDARRETFDACIYPDPTVPADFDWFDYAPL